MTTHDRRPLYCRIRAFDGALIEFETIYHRKGSSELIGWPSRMPIDGFLEMTFGHWYEGSSPPPAASRKRRGPAGAMDPQEIGESTRILSCPPPQLDGRLHLLL